MIANGEFTNWLNERNSFVLNHKGLKHPLFENLDNYVREKEFLHTAFDQIYHLVLGFPFHISGAIATSRDEDMLNVLVRNLYLEVGGDNGELHINLYRRLLRSVGCTTEKPSKDKLWKEAIELERNCDTLYRDADMGTKLGALYAFETMSSPMVAEWDRSLKKVTYLSADDYLFFTIHIDIEVDHANDIALITKKYWQNSEFERNFDRASSIIMVGLEQFWDRLKKVGDSVTTH
jgi:pyrroloquinoline quinone (PQQ) biosynthesis protein C